MPSTAPVDTRWSRLLGADRRQRARAGPSLLALAVYAVFAVLQFFAARMGMVDPDTAWALSAFNLSGATLLFLLVRSGLLHRHLIDAHTVMVQMGFAMVCISLAYTAAGPVRAVPLVLMTLVLPFGSFALRPGQMWGMAWLGFGLMGTAMVWRANTSPGVYTSGVEWLHAAAVGFALAAVGAVAANLGRLRAQLQGQRVALTEALARIQALAICDELTGLTNRREGLVRLHAMLGAAVGQRIGQADGVTLVLLDLDHFKRVNDEAGHAAGDAVLRCFADTARASLGPSVLVARWGGEEFLLGLPGRSPQMALQALGGLADALRGVTLDHIKPGLRITFSAGVACCDTPGELEATIARADAAMYQAKHSGRDRSVLADVPAQATPDQPAPRHTAVAAVPGSARPAELASVMPHTLADRPPSA